MIRPTVAILLSLLVAPVSAQDAATRQRWVVPEAGLSVSVPAGWAITAGNGGREILRNVAPGVVFGENVNLNVRVISEHPGLDKVLKLMRDRLEGAGMTVAKAEKGKTADGYPIALLEFVRRMAGMPGGKARFRQVVWYLGDAPSVTQVVCTMTCVEAMWAKTKPVFDAFQADLRLYPLGKLTSPKHPALPAQALPTFGFTATPPPGWLVIPAESERAAAVWVKRAPQIPRRKGSTILSVEVRPIPGARAGEFVKDVAKRMKAELTDGPTLGEEKTWVLTRATPWLKTVFAAKNELVYSISLEGSHAAKADGAVLDAFLKRWTWTPIAAAADHLKLAAKPQSILNTFVIRLPTIARPRKQQSKDALQWVVTDHVRRDVDVLVSHELARIPNVAAQRLSTFRDRFGKLVSRRLGFATPPTWEPSATPLPGYRSKPLRFTKGKVSLSIVYGVFFADRDTAVAITVTTSDPKTAELKAKYDKLAREIVDSVRLPRAVLATQRRR